MFRAVACDKFAPFGNLLMRFPPVENKPVNLAEVHLLTGVNGTGKSRLLSIMAAALGQVEPLKRRAKDIDAQIVFNFTADPNAQTNPNGWAGGHINGSLFHYVRAGPFQPWAKDVPAFAYGGMAYITDANITVMADVPKPDRAACLLFNRPEAQSAQLLQAIANLKVQAAMDLMNDADGLAGSGHAIRIIRALETVISKITRQRFAFQVFSYPKAVLSVTWGNLPSMSMDGLPDGLRSIIGWLVHAVVMMDALLQGKSNPLDTEAVFLLDEIEGFLHPAWQRKILPAFQALFPKAQIFVATHSPFLIASLNHGWIHQFTQEEIGKVKIEKPIPASEGDSYVTVVEDIMGVKEWYDPETEALLSEFRSKREAAYTGNPQALDEARALATIIGDRSMELGYMMGRELKQMDRQLATVHLPK